MKNIELVKGECPICHGPIDEEWAGANPSLGTVCKNCFGNQDEVFGPDNVEIEADKERCFDPILGIYEYVFIWKGTRIMVNGKVGTIVRPQADGDFVRFEGDDPESFGTFIKGVGYWDLLRIYKAQGGETEPMPLLFKEHVPTKAKLLDMPILPLIAEMKDGIVSSIQVGHNSIWGGAMYAKTELPNLPMLHAFTNMYVRYKFGLAPNCVVEGGFLGKNFEVRNAGTFIGGVGLSVRANRVINNLKSVSSLEDLQNLARTEGLIGLRLDHEQSRPGVIKDAHVNEVIATWVVVMVTLLRYDWRRFNLTTVESIWEHYCTMQDVLLNIMPAEELKAALNFAQGNKMRHFGCSY